MNRKIRPNETKIGKIVVNYTMGPEPGTQVTTRHACTAYQVDSSGIAESGFGVTLTTAELGMMKGDIADKGFAYLPWNP